jgi:hypothetical protein
MAAGESLQVEDGGRLIAFTFDDMMAYHGFHSPAGVAMAFKVMQRAFALISHHRPPQRREIVVRTAFRGPGARDGFEVVTRAVTDGRYTIDRSLVGHDRGRLLEDFVFALDYGPQTVTLLLRDGFVTAEFIDLARTDGRSDTEEARLSELKAALAQRIMATSAAELFDVV